MVDVRTIMCTVALSDAEKWDEATKTLTTKGGKSIPADYVIWAAGAKPNNIFAGITNLAATATVPPLQLSFECWHSQP